MGLKANSNKCYLIDYGLSKKYINSYGQHIDMTTDGSLTGTARYASLNNHLGYEQSRRDDLESLGYSMIYLLKGKLPWQGIRCDSDSERYAKILQAKRTTSLAELCKGIPLEFVKYIDYVRKLDFDEAPSYGYMRRLIVKMARDNNICFDYNYDWILRRKQEKA